LCNANGYIFLSSIKGDEEEEEEEERQKHIEKEKYMAVHLNMQGCSFFNCPYFLVTDKYLLAFK
jgi:Zn-finger protein